MNKALFAGGFGIAAAAFTFGLVYNYIFKKHKHISKQVVIEKLIATRQQLYPVMFQISYLVSKEMAPKGISPDEARLYILQNSQSGIKQKIQQILNEKVYNDIDQSSLQHAIQHTYKDDKQVLFYKQSFQQQFQKCFMGIQPAIDVTTISVLNKKNILVLVEDLLKQKIRRTKQIYDKTKDMKQLAQKMQKQKKQDQKYREKLLSQMGVKTKDKVHMLQISVQMFMKDVSFKKQYQQIIKSYQNQIKIIFQPKTIQGQVFQKTEQQFNP